MWGIKDIIMNMTIIDFIDISIVAYFFYKMYFLVKETRAEQLIKGIVILLLATNVLEMMQFQVIHWILERTMTVGIIALLIVFQPELRRALEQLGRVKFFSKSSQDAYRKSVDYIVSEVRAAVGVMSKSKTGALIVFERDTGLNEIVRTGTLLNADISRQLLINIFEPNTPLHDGAVIVRGEKILAAGCFLPLTDNAQLNQEVGTRHRAALGVSEKSDCIALVVSEETGKISIAENGKLYRDLSDVNLNRVLKRSLRMIDKTNLFESEETE